MAFEFPLHIRNYFRQESKPELADSAQPLLPEHIGPAAGRVEKEIHQPSSPEESEIITREESSDELAAQIQKIVDEMFNEDTEKHPFIPEAVPQEEEKPFAESKEKESAKKTEEGELTWFKDRIVQLQQQEDQAKRNYDAALKKVRGELPETSVSEDAQHLRLFEQKMEERDVIGKEVVSTLKEKIDSLTVEELKTLTDKTAEFVLSEGEAWAEEISFVENQKAREPERAEEIEAHSHTLEKEAETQKNLIPLTEEWLNMQNPAELARVAQSPFTVEHFLARHASLTESGKAQLKELVGIKADNQLEEDSLLGQALSLEDFQQRLNEKQNDYLEKAMNHPGLADRLLMFAQKKFQVSTDFDLVSMAIDACVKEVESASFASRVEEASDLPERLEPVHSEKIEEEEEEVPSTLTPSLQNESKNPQMEAAQEELKRLEQRKLELQKILESQWQSSRNGQESVSSSTQ